MNAKGDISSRHSMLLAVASYECLPALLFYISSITLQALLAQSVSCVVSMSYYACVCAVLAYPVAFATLLQLTVRSGPTPALQLAAALQERARIAATFASRRKQLDSTNRRRSAR